MRTLLYILAFNISAISFAQDPQLFDNIWYLYEVQSSDFGTFYDVSLINPPISPSLTIPPNLNYNGEGACNIFSGTYEFLPPEELSSINFTATTIDCGIQQHNFFENEYFSFISDKFWYTITQDGQGKVLTLENGVFGHAVFKSYSLSASNFQKNEFLLYPNPVKNNLFLSSDENIGNLNIKIFNIEGKLLSTQNTTFEKQVSIDVSSLVNGIYFLNIEDESGNVEIKKFIKE
ncbi:T9SS type A sorting domain-containing protein [Aequorivita lipolytica]|uniref:T9SS type A sorting domain-containing protein n=1 Tax=Aequorivita lipolytica TaxID=153267 RepID=A0A5C6YSV8_9FLAO|nr:T9SS type A sorting domain-containing protein [Aequorivita lipolytica]TXD70631.1 T9SS type A sorting domain-containing protein [Aequorivita lipolytica]